MKKILISVLVAVFLLVSNFGIPSTALSYDEKKDHPNLKNGKEKVQKLNFPPCLQ
jgi:hypothetical protein